MVRELDAIMYYIIFENIYVLLTTYLLGATTQKKLRDTDRTHG